MVNIKNLELKEKKHKKLRGNQVFHYIILNLPGPLDYRRFYSAEIESAGDVKVVFIELNQDEDEIIDFSDTCKCNTINAGMEKPMIKCKHIKDFENLLIRIGRYKPKDL